MLAPETPVLVLGARGMLGSDLCEVLSGCCRLTAWDIEELDITNRQAVFESIRELAPQEVINCAAFTDVDGCEEREKEAFNVNGSAPEYIAEACAAVGARLIQISTDYVFDGKKQTAYEESDLPNPINAYGRSKLAGENAVAESGCRFAIIRSQWLYGRGGKNFIDTISKLAAEQDVLRVVNDQFGRPTWTRDLADALVEFIGSDGEGIYHLAAGGSYSWYDVAQEIVSIKDLPVKVEPVATAAFPRPAARPGNAVLNCTLIAKKFGISMRDWKEALREYLLDY